MPRKETHMKKRFDGFVWIGLGIVLLMALFLSPFASTSPDGLEKVVETKGFAEKGESWKFWKHAPLPDYSLPWIKNEKVSTAISGLIGTLAIFFMVLGIGRLIKKSPSGRRVFLIPLSLFLMFFSTSAYAAHPLITDDTGTQGKGKFQVEVNSEVNYDKESEDGVKTKTTGGEVATIISFGIIDNLDIVLSVPYQWFKVKEDGEIISREKGFSDISLELKWRFYERGGWSFAIKPGVTFPTGKEEKDLGTGRVTSSFFFITTKEIEPLAFHLNLGYLRNENKLDERKNLWHISLASELKLIKNLRLVANIGAERNPDRASNKHPAFILGGFIYSITKNFDMDIGIKGGLNKPETDLTILAGMSFRF
jgi:hypothetical protein